MIITTTLDDWTIERTGPGAYPWEILHVQLREALPVTVTVETNSGTDRSSVTRFRLKREAKAALDAFLAAGGVVRTTDRAGGASPEGPHDE